MPTLLDAARQAAAPPADETPPELLRRPRAPTLLDAAQQAPPPPPPDQPPELLRRPAEDEEPTAPPARPRRTGELAGAIVGRRGFVGPYRSELRTGEEGEPEPGQWERGYEYPDPNAVREPTWGETALLTGARVVPPIAAAAVTTPVLGPIGG